MSGYARYNSVLNGRGLLSRKWHPNVEHQLTKDTRFSNMLLDHFLQSVSGKRNTQKEKKHLSSPMEKN